MFILLEQDEHVIKIMDYQTKIFKIEYRFKCIKTFYDEKMKPLNQKTLKQICRTGSPCHKNYGLLKKNV